MSSTYTPQPGTIPAKVIEYLKGQPEGHEAAAVEICEAIGQDTINLTPFLTTPEKHGLLKRSRKEGSRAAFWSLGDGKPVAPPVDDEEEPDNHPVVQRVLPASAPATQPHIPLPKFVPNDHFSVSADLNNTLLIRTRDSNVTLNSEQLQLVMRMAIAIGITA